VTATITNNGTAGASNFNVVLFLDCLPSATCPQRASTTVSSLAAGASTDVIFSDLLAISAPGSHVYYVMADYGNLIGETNENDNLGSVTFNVQAYSTPTPACFLSGTQISTPRGDKPIETLTAGDRVWSFDEQTGKVVANEVEELVTSQTDAYYIIETASGRQIKATGDHPVYTGRQLSLRESLWTRIRGLFHM
jgi:uncharacterized repeat protein (TIGR01451 family)